MQNDLFAEERAGHRAAAEPLPAKMRPKTLDEVVGQEHLLGAGCAFRTMVEQGRPVSMILWGPPGTGKTTLARLVAGETAASFEQLSAVSAGVKDVREVLATARQRLEMEGRRTVLFLDEIHRFNKAQQDALLPGVEAGTVILVGATTENPFFEVNSPLISRCTLFRLEPLGSSDLAILIRRAARVLEESGRFGEIDEGAVESLAERTGGDARLALNALEMASHVALGRNALAIEVEDIEESLQRRVIRYDKSGDQHYDIISAFIKSMRGSDPDAALFWLHTMLEAGEDPEFIGRRMIIFASEDVGLADPSALSTAVAAFHALQVVGLPEATFALSHAALHLAIAPKSNSITTAMADARRAVESTPGAQVPSHLRDSHYPGANRLGHGSDYQYPHDHPGHVVRQQYLPDALDGQVFFRPGLLGEERKLAERLAQWDEVLGRLRRTSGKRP